MRTHKILKVAPTDLPLQTQLSGALGIPGILAQLLINRGYATLARARAFLSTSLKNLHDPYDFSQMRLAVARVKHALAHGETIGLVGDYDVDGITALAVLKNAFLSMGVDVAHYLPHRIKEGYGLNANVVQWAKDKKIKLLITVDCGSNSHEVIGALRKAHIEVIVTDHHELSGQAPAEATAVINPKVDGCGYPFRDLAGVAVAFKFAQAFTGKPLEEELDLVTLGTIADVVPLTGENRILVKEGLRRLSKTGREGIKALLRSSRIGTKPINTQAVSFILGPRINASGRMDSAETSLQLLMSVKAEAADVLAQQIEGYNRERQKIEKKIIEEALLRIDQEINFKKHKVIVVASDDWHHGVLGIVAAKIADKYYRPTIMISKGERSCKGSGRSIKGFHLFEALCACADLLENFGGHSHAIGLVIAKDNIERFKEKINAYAVEKLMIEDLMPTIEVDMEVALADLTEEAVVALEKLEPFGTANTRPLFYCAGLTVKSQPQLLSRDTLKFWVAQGDTSFAAIGFGMGAQQERIAGAKHIDLVFTPRMDTWGGNNAVILEIKEAFSA